MDKIKRAIEFLEKQNDTYFETQEGKIILSNLELFKKELNNKKISTNNSCDHDIEDICAYTENKLSENETKRVDKIISECDSCFETFYQLKEVYEIIKTPERIKNKLKDDEELKKNIFSSTFKKLKENFAYTGSGIIVGFATALFMFFIILPNKQNITINTNSGGVFFTGIENSKNTELFYNALEEKKKGNFLEATDKMEAFLEKNPDSIEAEWELAQLYKQQNKPTSAQRHFESYLKKARNFQNSLEKNIKEAENEIKK